jgi:hypothetical protein
MGPESSLLSIHASHKLPCMAWDAASTQHARCRSQSVLGVYEVLRSLCQAVLRMLEAIGSRENIPEALARAKDKKDPFRLMGFGHRVYKTFDPRWTILARTACKHLPACMSAAGTLALFLTCGACAGRGSCAGCATRCWST